MFFSAGNLMSKSGKEDDIVFIFQNGHQFPFAKLQLLKMSNMMNEVNEVLRKTTA